MMKKIKLAFLGLFAASLIAGCATTGTISGLKKGETDKDSVRNLLGEPDKKETSGEGDVWIYRYYDEVRPGRARLRGIDIKVVFKDNTVGSYEIIITEPERVEKRPGPDIPAGLRPERPFPRIGFPPPP